MLEKRAIEELCPTSLSPGFYSRIFLVPKKDGGWRPVFDLNSLNHFIRKEKFRMITPRVVTNALNCGYWVISVDLKDAYFHIPKQRKSRHLLRFAIAGNDGLRVFQFRAMPFGLTSVPRVFTKVILPISHLAHTLQYLDEWLLRNTDKTLLVQQTSWLLRILRRVGLVLNVPKSQLPPTQRLIHIGVEYWLDVGLMFPPMDRVHKIESGVSLLLSVQVTTAYFWLFLLGCNGCHRLGEIASQASAALLPRSLVPSIESSVGTDTSETQLTRSPPSPVVEQKVHPSRNVAGHSRGSDAVVYRRVGVGLGSPFRHFPRERRMVCEDGYSPYQSTGNASGTQCVDSIQDTIVRHNCSIDVGQRNRCVIHNEAGWHNLRTNVSASEGSAPRSMACEYLPSGQAHSGRTECTSRPSVQNE